jgi:hypothetical protein
MQQELSISRPQGLMLEAEAQRHRLVEQRNFLCGMFFRLFFGLFFVFLRAGAALCWGSA